MIYVTVHGQPYRLFQGHTTHQVDGHLGKAAQPLGWYFEHADYDGDVLYSDAYPTPEAAAAAAAVDASAFDY